jgi:hypothetical protein
MMAVERGLQRMQLAGAAEARCGRDTDAIRLHRKHHAGFCGVAVDQHRAGAAAACFAADVRRGDAELFPQRLHQQQPRLDGEPMAAAVDSECDWKGFVIRRGCRLFCRKSLLTHVHPRLRPNLLLYDHDHIIDWLARVRRK